MAKKDFRATGWNENINLVVYFSLILSGMGVTWLALNNVPSGIRYITIFLVGVSFLVVTFFFLNEQQKETIKQLMHNPFTTDYDVATGLYLLGWMLPILFTFIFNLFKFKFSIAQLMIPLSATEIVGDITVAQSFAVAEAQTSPFWQWFITVFTAGSIEEFVFGFVLMLVGVSIGMLVWRLFFKGQPAETNTSRTFYIIFGLIFTGLIFGGVHKLNATYVGYMFFVAIIFRIVMNYSIYFLGLFLSLTLGYHQSNNAVWYWGEYGASSTFKALGSLGGIIIVGFFALILLYVLRNIENVAKKTVMVFRKR